ncbi:MAG: CinA family nicotinamide mononucleotide deamidase-related protein [Lentisphaerae bacterium]|nr:CinA family nicotinamide mononucleotide deamidase-related protein [Lentisphaerota bacterium]
MNIAFISTGTELLKGSAVNTNLRCFGSSLAAAGIPLHQEIACGDRKQEIAEALSAALKSSEILLISGGLGPTSDDITLETVARFFGLELHQDAALTEKIEKFWKALGRSIPCPKAQFKQAMLPESGVAIDNPRGSASGIYIKVEYAKIPRHIFLVPGPPSEFEPMIAQSILPAILDIVPDRLKTVGFLCAGVGESTVAKTLEKPVTALGVEIAYCADASGTRVFLSAQDDEKLILADRTAHDLMGSSAMPDGILDPVTRTIALLKEKNLTLSTAESCTGGMIANSIVEHSGVSSVFAGGAVTYSNALKEKLLSVPGEVLEKYGAVSEECACAMAKGAAENMGTTAAVATTGIAGPDGGTPEKPVGLVYVAACVNGEIMVRKLNLRGGRLMIRQRAAAQALILLNSMLETL